MTTDRAIKSDLESICESYCDEIQTGIYEPNDFDEDRAEQDTRDKIGDVCDYDNQEEYDEIFNEHMEKLKHEKRSSSDYLDSTLGIHRYVISPDLEYRSGEVLLCWGGPNVYIDTSRKVIEGYWGSEHVERFYTQDPLGIDDYMEEMYDCIRQ